MALGTCRTLGGCEGTLSCPLWFRLTVHPQRTHSKSISTVYRDRLGPPPSRRLTIHRLRAPSRQRYYALVAGPSSKRPWPSDTRTSHYLFPTITLPPTPHPYYTPVHAHRYYALVAGPSSKRPEDNRILDLKFQGVGSLQVGEGEGGRWGRGRARARKEGCNANLRFQGAGKEGGVTGGRGDRGPGKMRQRGGKCEGRQQGTKGAPACGFGAQLEGRVDAQSAP